MPKSKNIKRERRETMTQLPSGVSMSVPHTQKRKRLLAEITGEQMGLCSRDYRQHLAVCEEYDTEPINFVIFAAEWLEVRAKVEKTPKGEGSNDDCGARNYNAMYYGKKGYG
jgi:hypothetical protein